MIFTEQQLQVKKLVDVQQDIEIDALNDGVGALSSTMQNGFTEAANNFYDIQNSLESMNTLSNERYNGLTSSVNAISNAMTQGFLDIGNTIANTAENTQITFNQINANISDSINNLNEQITNELSVKELSVDTMIYNVSATPISSLTALGYDSNGKVIPVTVIANHNVVLPENANYIYTGASGTPYAGMADTTVSTNENLITSHAVYNAVNDIWTDLNGFHNDVNNSFGDIHNNFNTVDNTLAGVYNQFNDVNNSFNGVYNQFNDVNNAISGIDNNLYFLIDSIGIFTPMYYINSTNPVNYKAVNNVVFTKGAIGNLWSESSLLGNRYYDWNSSTNTLTFSSPTGIIFFNSNMFQTFYRCGNLNSNILIPNSVTNMASTFSYCNNFNQNILIPNSVTNMSSTFSYCNSLNQNILIPNSVTRMVSTFSYCNNLNQNILIPNSVTDMSSTFANCSNFNQNILIPNSVTDIFQTFANCSSLNQNILIPNSITDMIQTFLNCSSFNQNILIPNSVTNMYDTFSNCHSLNQNILIPNSVTELAITFYNCGNLNQNIYLYSDKITSIMGAFNNCSLLSDKYIHILNTIPMDTSNSIYNALVNSFSGINWTGRVVNDLQEPTTWPPIN